MREIRFRFWDAKEGKWLGKDSSYWKELTFEDCRNKLIASMRQGNIVAEQYTGLKDKNGKEIYEGDIITEKYRGFPDGKFCRKGPAMIIDWWVVEYNEKRAGFLPFCDCDDNGEYLYEEHIPKKHLEVEVVGNIHENPELLGGEE